MKVMNAYDTFVGGGKVPNSYASFCQTELELNSMRFWTGAQLAVELARMIEEEREAMEK